MKEEGKGRRVRVGDGEWEWEGPEKASGCCGDEWEWEGSEKASGCCGMTGTGAALGSALGLEAGQQAAAPLALLGEPALHCGRKRKQGRVLGWGDMSLPTHPCLDKEMPMQ